MSRQLTTSLLLFAPFLLGGVNGADVCTCQPSKFSLSIDTSLTCETSTISSVNPGIQDTTCIVQSSSGTRKTETPTQIVSIEISELNQELNKIRTSVFNDTFVSGDKIRFASRMSSSVYNLHDVDDVTARPKGLQATIIGIDNDGLEITNNWVLLFSNECNIYPVISTGQQIGWTKFVSKEQIIQKFHSIMLRLLYHVFNPMLLNFYFVIIGECHSSTS